MICPYVKNTYTRITMIHYNDNEAEDGSVIHERYANIECKKEECGAWNKGRCRYNENND